MAVYAVTGGAGFIGSHLCDALLEANHRVRVIDDFSTGSLDNLDPHCEILRGDICDLGLLRRAMDGAAGCFHLAAIASVARGNEDWSGTHRVNQGGTVAVLEAARLAGRNSDRIGGIPVVYASSAAVYGNASGIATEADLPAPQTAYGADKLGSEVHAQVGHHVHGVPSIGFRFFNVYGPRQDPNSPYSGVISIFSRAIGSGLPLTVHGSGKQTRDFVFVRDVVSHLMMGMELLQKADVSHVLNVCTGRETSLLDLIETLSTLTGRRTMVLPGPVRAGDIARSVGSPAQSIALLHVRAETPLLEGLRLTLEYLSSVPVMEQA